MAGLLEDFGEFAKTPAGQGLLAAAFGGLAGARSGAPINSIGRAGLAGMQGYSGAIDRQQQLAEAEQAKRARDMQMQTQQMQLDAFKREQERQAKEEALAAQFYKTGTQGTAPLMGDSILPPDLQTGILPSKGTPSVPASFDMSGYSNAMMGVNPTKGIALLQSMAKETPFNKVDPKDYTPESLAKFGTTRDYADLVPRSKMEVSEGVVWDPYNTKPQTVLPNFNKPFMPDGKGGVVANLPFQQYEIGKAAAGASRTTNNNINAGDNEYVKAQGKDYAEMMSGINKAGFSAPAQLRKLERMMQLLDGVEGGKLAPMGTDIASTLNSFGIKIDPKLGNKEASAALSREIAGGFRQPGTGPMTDKDFDNFLLQVPDLSKSAAGRKQITKTMQAALARDIEVSKRARAYEKKNGRIDGGFMDEISQYVAENPVVALPDGYKVVR